jgi:hypothetical protein
MEERKTVSLHVILKVQSLLRDLTTLETEADITYESPSTNYQPI